MCRFRLLVSWFFSSCLTFRMCHTFSLSAPQPVVGVHLSQKLLPLWQIPPVPKKARPPNSKTVLAVCVVNIFPFLLCLILARPSHSWNTTFPSGAFVHFLWRLLSNTFFFGEHFNCKNSMPWMSRETAVTSFLAQQTINKCDIWRTDQHKDKQWRTSTVRNK